MDAAARFKVLCADAGLSVDAAAQLLHVSPRTIYAWFSGAAQVPYAAYKLVRVLRYFELPGDAWRGWHFAAGKLWSPEGFGFEPHESSWWSLLVRQARCFQALYERAQAGRSDVPDPADRASAAPGGRAAAQPPLNLFLEHFRASTGKILANPPSVAINSIADFSQSEMEVCHGG
jgi:hypothetical protein